MCFCRCCVMYEASMTGSKWALTGTVLLMLQDGEKRVTHKPPGLHGTPWDTVPAAGTWVSLPGLRPSNKPSQQICIVTQMENQVNDNTVLLIFWSIWCQIFCLQVGMERIILKINEYYCMLAALKWKETKMSDLDFMCRFQFFMMSYQNTSANTEISYKCLKSMFSERKNLKEAESLSKL